MLVESFGTKRCLVPANLLERCYRTGNVFFGEHRRERAALAINTCTRQFFHLKCFSLPGSGACGPRRRLLLTMPVARWVHVLALMANRTCCLSGSTRPSRSWTRPPASGAATLVCTTLLSASRALGSAALLVAPLGGTAAARETELTRRLRPRADRSASIIAQSFGHVRFRCRIYALLDLAAFSRHRLTRHALILRTPRRSGYLAVVDDPPVRGVQQRHGLRVRVLPTAVSRRYLGDAISTKVRMEVAHDPETFSRSANSRDRLGFALRSTRRVSGCDDEQFSIPPRCATRTRATGARQLTLSHSLEASTVCGGAWPTRGRVSAARFRSQGRQEARRSAFSF